VIPNEGGRASGPSSETPAQRFLNRSRFAMTRCFSAPDDWTDLRMDLTDGERHLATRLIETLSKE